MKIKNKHLMKMKNSSGNIISLEFEGEIHSPNYPNHIPVLKYVINGIELSNLPKIKDKRKIAIHKIIIRESKKRFAEFVKDLSTPIESLEEDITKEIDDEIEIK